MITVYFWRNGKVVEYQDKPITEFVQSKRLLGLLCIDVTASDPEQRYGIFNRHEGWEHVPLKQFPKEFLASLLLLGVSV